MLFELSVSGRPLEVSVREFKDDIVESANISRKGPQVRDRTENVLASTAASFHVTCKADLTSNRDRRSACVSCFAWVHRTNSWRQIVELIAVRARNLGSKARCHMVTSEKPSCLRASTGWSSLMSVFETSVQQKSQWPSIVIGNSSGRDPDWPRLIWGSGERGWLMDVNLNEAISRSCLQQA